MDLATRKWMVDDRMQTREEEGNINVKNNSMPNKELACGLLLSVNNKKT